MHRIGALLLVTLILGPGGPWWGAARAAHDSGAKPQIEVVTHPAAPGSVDPQTLRGIFLLRIRTWPDGTPIRVFVMPLDSQLHDEFTRERLGTYPYILKRAWNRVQFTGTGLRPQVVRSAREMQRRVMETPGAIGYRRADSNSQEGRSTNDDRPGEERGTP